MEIPDRMTLKRRLTFLFVHFFLRPQKREKNFFLLYIHVCAKLFFFSFLRNKNYSLSGERASGFYCQRYYSRLFYNCNNYMKKKRKYETFTTRSVNHKDDEFLNILQKFAIEILKKFHK